MLNWRELPFVRLLFPLVAGIVSSYYFDFSHPAIFWFTVFLLIILRLFSRYRGLYRHRHLFGVLVCFFIFLAAYQIGHFHDERNADDYFGEKINKEEAFFLVTVSDAPVRKEKWVRLKTVVEHSGNHLDSLTKNSGHLLLYVSRDYASEAISYGDQMLLHGRVTEVGPPGNPHAFDYQKYLHFQNIHHQSFIRPGDWQIVGEGFGNPFFAKAINMQSKFLATLRKHLPTENELAVGSALILGYRDEIPEDVKTAYSQTGAMHVLAVSGLHVGVVFLLLNFFLKKVKLNLIWWRLAKMTIVLSAIWTFALVTGLSPSVTRAAVMFSCMQVGLAMNRDSNVYNTLAASAFLMLIWNPYSLASVSFQLSYLAVFGIVFFQSRFAQVLYIRNYWLNKIWQLFCVSMAAQLMLVPLTLYYFHQFPTYFWLSSLLLVPLAGFELSAGLLLLFFESIWPMAAAAVGKLLWFMLWLGNEFVLLVQNLPGAIVDGVWMGGLVVALLYFVLTSSMMAVASQKIKWAISGLAFFALVSVNFAFTSWEQEESRQVVIYNVNRHTAIDIFEGKNVVNIVSSNVDEKALTFATEGHRWAMGMSDIHSIPLMSRKPHEVGNVFFENKFLQFDDFKMAIVADDIPFDLTKKIKVDYVLVRGSPKIFIDEILDKYDFKKIIFDGSNKKWQIGKWKLECERLRVGYYDIIEEGAFVLDFKK